MKKVILILLLIFGFTMPISAKETTSINEPFFIEKTDYALELSFDEDYNLKVNVLQINKDLTCTVYGTFHVNEDGSDAVQFNTYNFDVLSKQNSVFIKGYNNHFKQANYYSVDYNCYELEHDNDSLNNDSTYKNKDENYDNAIDLLVAIGFPFILVIVIFLILIIILIAILLRSSNIDYRLKDKNECFKPIRSVSFEKVAKRNGFNINDMTLKYYNIVTALRGTKKDMELTLYIIDNLENMMLNNKYQKGYNEFLKSFEEFKKNNDSIYGLFVSYFEDRGKFIYYIYVDGSVLFAVCNSKNKRKMNNIINQILRK